MAMVTMMCGSLLVIQSSPLHKRDAAAWVLDATVNVVVGVLVVDVVMVMVMVMVDDVVVSAIFAAWRSRWACL